MEGIGHEKDHRYLEEITINFASPWMSASNFRTFHYQKPFSSSGNLAN